MKSNEQNDYNDNEVYSKREINNMAAGKSLSKINLSFICYDIKFETFWCRGAFDFCDNWNYKTHRHSFYELHLCTNGSCVFCIDKKNIEVTKNTFIVIPAKKKHTLISTSGDFSKFVWGFKVETNNEKYKNFIELFDVAIQNVELKNATDEILSMINLIFTNSLKKHFDYYSVIKFQLYCLFISVSREFVLENRLPNDDAYYKKYGYDMTIAVIKKYIYDNISSGLKNEDIANQFHISERQLRRICKLVCNMTLSELKRTIQVDYIRKLIATTDYSLKEIAYKTGFCDEYSMGKTFKQIEGLSPGKYRSSLKE